MIPETQYAFTGDMATFECATDTKEYGLSFTVSGGVSHYPTVKISSGGGQRATTSFVVTAENNGSYVRCFGDNGVDFVATSRAFGYAQG